jgi:magnesium-transporting ATPase (P-type)
MFDEFDFFKDTVRDQEVINMMEMFTLCHNSMPSGNSFESNSIVEKAMLLFAKNFNFNFSVDKEKAGDEGILKHYRIKGASVDDKTIGVNIYIINLYDEDRKRFSVLVGKDGQSGATLYVRGEHEVMNGLIKFGEDQKSYNDVVKYNESTGLSTFVFAKRELNATLTKELVKEFMNHKKKQLDQHINLKKLAIRMEQSLKLVSVVGFKNKAQPDAIPVIQNLKDMGVRVSMLTGDNLHHSKLTCNVLKIIGFEEDAEHLNFRDLPAGRQAIKEVLERFKKLTTEKKKPPASGELKTATTAVDSDSLRTLNDTVLIFSGASWNVIRNSHYLLSHFLFICQFAKSIIGYEMSSLNKKEFIVEFIRSNSGGDKTVVAVGDGLNDIGMLQEASVGIQLRSPAVDIAFGDILIDNLAVIPLMMKREGRKLHSNLTQTILIVFGQSWGFGLLNFFYQFYCSFTGSPIINTDYLLITQIFILINGLVFVLAESQYTTKIMNMYPAFYLEKNHAAKKTISSFLQELI